MNKDNYLTFLIARLVVRLNYLLRKFATDAAECHWSIFNINLWKHEHHQHISEGKVVASYMQCRKLGRAVGKVCGVWFQKAVDCLRSIITLGHPSTV